jgi:uncharacterized protein (TIGR02118 family)
VSPYDPPADAAALDAYVDSTHLPIAKRMPGPRAPDVSAGPVVTAGGPAPYHEVAVLDVDSLAGLQAAAVSADGQAAVGDTANFASGGVIFPISEERTV